MNHFGWHTSQPSESYPAAVPHPGSRPNPQVPVAKLKQRRHKHSEEEWDTVRDIIIRLYIGEDKKAEEVHKILNAEHDFPIGLRKLKAWLTSNGISKNVQKADMLVLYAKRLDRMKVGGKKTIICKDGRILDDVRLDRFGTRYFLESDYATYLAAATPEGYTYGTPQPAPADEEPEVSLDPLLFQVFTTPGYVQTILGEVFDSEVFQERTDHIHQIGVFGLRLLRNEPAEKVPLVLRQCLLFAKDLMSSGTSSSSSPSSGLIADAVSTQSPPNERVPRVHIAFTAGDTHNGFKASASDAVITYLKGSDLVMQLLQLAPADQRKWRLQWYAMSPEEQASSKVLCDTFFGLTSSYSSSMSFMHISVLLASPRIPVDTVLVRLSLGIDMRDVPNCSTCQRRVMTLDCISKAGAVQLNVPLQVAWSGAWEPFQVFTSEFSEHGKWSDYVYTLRGHFIHLSSYLHEAELISQCSIESGEDSQVTVEKAEWEERWDPMDVFTPLSTFQPNDGAVPASLCAYTDFELTQPAAMNRESDSSVFAPDVGDNDTWDPDGI